jgi:transposase
MGTAGALLPAMTPQRGGRWPDHRQVLNGILFRVRTGVPWRDVPERYGPWETLYKRFARWQTDGTWAQIEASLRTQADGAGQLDWDAQVDSSVVRAHQHAAGARKGGSARSGKPAASAGAVTRWLTPSSTPAVMAVAATWPPG